MKKNTSDLLEYTRDRYQSELQKRIQKRLKMLRKNVELTWSLRPNGWYGLTPGGSNINQIVAPITCTDINSREMTTWS